MYKAEDTVALMLNVNTERPLQAQLFEQVRAMIIDGQLEAGAALPATRALSEQLGVSRNTVVLAYDRLLTEGYIESKRSIGTFVSEAVPRRGLWADNGNNVESDRADDADGPDAVALTAARHLKKLQDVEKTLSGGRRGTAGRGGKGGLRLVTESGVPASQLHKDDAIEIDFCMTGMEPQDFPLRSWRRIVNRVSSHADDYMNASDEPMGNFDLRRAIADHLGPARGILAQPDEVMIVDNAQQGRALLAELLIEPGAPAVMEVPGPIGAARLFAHKGAKIHDVPVDDDGMDTSVLPNVDGAANGGLCYVSPSQQVPMGVSMPLARRVELLEWAQRARLVIVEDEADSDFGASGAPLTALKGLDGKGAVVYLGSFEKSMGAGVGPAYLVLPQRLVAAATAIKSLMMPGPSPLNQAVMAAFIECGAFDRHLRKLRKKCMEKRSFLIEQLSTQFGPFDHSEDAGGLQLVWPLKKGMGTADALVQRAGQHGLGLYTIETAGAYTGRQASAQDEALVFGFQGLTMSEISDGVGRLARLIETGKNAPGLAAAGETR